MTSNVIDENDWKLKAKLGKLVTDAGGTSLKSMHALVTENTLKFLAWSVRRRVRFFIVVPTHIPAAATGKPLSPSAERRVDATTSDVFSLCGRNEDEEDDLDIGSMT